MPPINPKVWGPHVWIFFHVLIEKIKDDSFKDVNDKIFFFIKEISKFLACKECSYHATNYLNNTSNIDISTKKKFIITIFNFHNDVNIRKSKKIFLESELNMYKKYNLNETIKNFIFFFKPRLYFFENSFIHNKIKLVEELEQWLNENKQNFNI